jgi:uncharacterized damage-inducible protein DinB
MTETASIQHLWRYNAALLAQAVGMIERLQTEAIADFNYAQAVGPHLRHVLEHYQALLHSLADPTLPCVQYDARGRDMQVQSLPMFTLAKLHDVIGQCDRHSDSGAFALDTPIMARLQTGPIGAMELTVGSTLGRELLFLSSHTTHHYALVAHYCSLAGVDLGHDFGKAPSTVAFERKGA